MGEVSFLTRTSFPPFSSPLRFPPNKCSHNEQSPASHFAVRVCVWGGVVLGGGTPGIPPDPQTPLPTCISSGRWISGKEIITRLSRSETWGWRFAVMDLVMVARMWFLMVLKSSAEPQSLLFKNALTASFEQQKESIIAKQVCFARCQVSRDLGLTCHSALKRFYYVWPQAPHFGNTVSCCYNSHVKQPIFQNFVWCWTMLCNSLFFLFNGHISGYFYLNLVFHWSHQHQQ